MNATWFVPIVLILASALAAKEVLRAEAVTLRTLTKIGFSGLTMPQQLVIKNEKAWQELWTVHAVDRETIRKVPKVDFSKEMVIAVALGQQRSGGYLVEIVGVESDGERLKITYKRKSPPPDSIVLQLVTTPVHFVAVPRSELKPEFVEEKK